MAKIRLGFVSNSSSSSFCIIGTSNKNIISKCLEVDKIDWSDLENTDYGYGELKTKKLNYYGTYEEDYPYYAGIEAEKFLEDKTIPEAKKYFINYIKENYNETISLKEVEFIYGECGS